MEGPAERVIAPGGEEAIYEGLREHVGELLVGKVGNKLLTHRVPQVGDEE